jgi:hypothetical protein
VSDRPPSRVIQLVTGHTHLGHHVLYALCEDGAIWSRTLGDGDYVWKLINGEDGPKPTSEERT